MKNYIYILVLCLLTFSCEDVIEIDAPSEKPKLNIDALVRVDTSKARTAVKLNAGLTSSFFNDIQAAELSQIYITNLKSELNLVLRESEPGVYVGIEDTSFFTDGELVLLIEHLDQKYAARATFIEASPITKLEQGDGSLFEGNENHKFVD